MGDPVSVQDLMDRLDGIEQTNNYLYNAVDSSGNIIATETATWADDAPANTQVEVDITAPGLPQPDGVYTIIVFNPSAETSLTVVVMNKITVAGEDKYVPHATFSVPVNYMNDEGVSYNIQGWMDRTDGGKILISNDMLLGGTGGFTATIAVRKV